MIDKIKLIILNKKVNFLIFFIIILYLVFLTGYVSDDFSEINNTKEYKNNFPYLPFKNFINIPVLYYTHYIFYYFVSLDNIILLSLIKFFYTAASFYMVVKFFSIFTNLNAAFLISFFFIFWPTHDSTVYFYLGQYLMLSISLHMYTYYLLHQNYYKSSIIFSILASFISYGSTPVAVSLFLLFCLNKEYKKSLYILIPNCIYILYYISVSKILSVSISRLPSDLDIFSTFKVFFLQIITLIDANIGPSFILKIYFSILENSLTSISLVFVVIALFLLKKNFQNSRNSHFKLNYNLIISLIVATLLSILMFTLTGGYFQNAFNLGNRVTIYPSIFLSYLLVYLMFKYNSFFIASILILISIFGISEHWKSLQNHQSKVMNNIMNNTTIQNTNNNEYLYVMGNQYSKLGPFSNIEFFAASHSAESIFKLMGHRDIKIKTLNGNFIFKDKKLIDLKYKFREYPVSENIQIYNSEKDLVMIIDEENIEEYLSSTERDIRHWTQLISNNYIINILKKNYPKLNYLF